VALNKWNHLIIRNAIKWAKAELLTNNTYIGNKLQRLSAMHRGFLNCRISQSFTVSSPTYIQHCHQVLLVSQQATRHQKTLRVKVKNSATFQNWPAWRRQQPFCENSSLRRRNGTTRSLVRVRALRFLQGFETNGWVQEKYWPLKMHSTNLQRFFSRTGEGGPKSNQMIEILLSIKCK